MGRRVGPTLKLDAKYYGRKDPEYWEALGRPNPDMASRQAGEEPDQNARRALFQENMSRYGITVARELDDNSDREIDEHGERRRHRMRLRNLGGRTRVTGAGRS